MTDTEMVQRVNSITSGDNELKQAFSYMCTLGLPKETLLEKITLLESLKQAMKDGIVNFVFKKVNGETREAFGTRAEDVLRTHSSTPAGKRRSSSSTFSYYDIEKSDWRCFKPELLIKINTDYTI